MTEASAVTWLDIDGEFSGIQPGAFKLNPHLMSAIAKQRKEHHLHEVLKPSLDVGLPVIDQTYKFIFEIQILNTFHFATYLTI